MARLLSRRLFVAAACGAMIIPWGAGTASASPPTGRAPVVVVSGLNNPRGLALVGAALLVAEAGKGGTVATSVSPDGPPQGLGYTGSVSAVFDPAQAHGQLPHRLVTGLLSSAASTAGPGQPVGGAANGTSGVAARSLRRLAIIETTFGSDTPATARPRDGHLLLARPYGPVRPVADISAYEKVHDPDRQGVDTNPFAVITYRGGWLVADAAGNDVLRVSPQGRISLFHVFPNIRTGACAALFDPTPLFPGCNFVPTSLAADRSGNVYVGALAGLVPGQGEVVRLDSRGNVRASWTGFTAVDGVALGRDDSVYISQLFAPPASPGIPGVVTKISDDGHRTNVDVPFPAGIAVDDDDNVYVSAYSIFPDSGAGIPGLDTSGQVWRLRM